ncbi:HlyD family efflux transporter periplasmic adaptor subunit [Pontibacter sp. E15-1]|uniref:efflux RND transporter periplasmic adaptor subunit n=1 Tax=Pontibacter sp. E15-1 TaxID=2919918 RepID=UPI001F501923|nr:HlyD family efflux transporter periplasmic adaptor subunit [Pontibacter sp. E15-1]MCJ8164624.1 HlyD family efflux transporter periplasmic adaptor subunit [Pontibacter sp. E15-1]
MKHFRHTCCLPLVFLLAFCSSPNEPATADVVEVKTPVTITTVSQGPIKETLDLNATSSYQRKNTVKAATAGYVQRVFVKPGERVRAGATLFTLKTKEAQVLGDLMTQDPALPFTGIITVKAPASGLILELSRQTGDYVNDGDQLAILSDLNSFVFLVNVPFELHSYSTVGTSVTILLPDSTKLPGTVTSGLASMSAGAQTQQFVIRPQTSALLPENLQAVVRFNKKVNSNAQVLDRAAVLTNETMDSYWVMKLINDTTAVKIPVKTGITAKHTIEIISPSFAPSDRILVSGNYGLSDTAYVSIQNRKPE